VPLKKPSDLFGDNSPEENNIPIVEVSEENFDNVFNVFNTYKKYLDDFELKLESVNYLSEQITSLKDEINQAIRKEDLDKAILAQLLYVNESINNIENNVKTINEEKLNEIRNDSSYLLKKVETFIDDEIPKHKKRITEFELKVEEEIGKVNDATSSVVSIEESIEKTIGETKDQFDDYEKRIEYIENYLKKSALGSFKKSLQERISRIRSDVNDNENKVRRQTIEIENVKKEIFEALETLKKESLQKEIDAVISSNQIITKSVDHLKEESKIASDKFDEEVVKIQNLREGLEKRNLSFSKKIADLQKLYETIEINNTFISEQVEKKESTSATKDPLAPLDQKFATLQDLQDHYRLFINRIQQQLTSLGGGGAGQLREMSDFADFPAIKTNSAAYDSKFLAYNNSTNLFELKDEVKRLVVNATNPGAGTTHTEDFVVEGNARVVGILTIGEASITLDAETGRIASGDVEILNEGGGASYIGTVTAGDFVTIGGGDAIGINSTTISGPSVITIDPAAVGDNTGTVRIKGDLIVEGTETKIESQTLEISDKTIGIASASSPLNDTQLDGAGIVIHGSNSNKSLTWDNSNSRLGFSTDIHAPRYFGDGSNLTINLGDLANVDTSNVGAGIGTNFLLVFDPTIPGFKLVDPTTLGINNDYNTDIDVDDFGTYP